jgi:hypothetical protein
MRIQPKLKLATPVKLGNHPNQKTLAMFSKFRVSKRSAATENEETPGLVLVSTSRISQASKRFQLHPKLSLILVGPADTALEDPFMIKNVPAV